MLLDGHDPAAIAQCLGLRCVTQDGGLRIKTVLRGGLAEQAGFAAGDDWLGVELPASGGQEAPAWRLRTLDDLPCLAGPHTTLTALVGRGARLQRLPLRYLREATSWRLTVSDRTQLVDWLQPSV